MTNSSEFGASLTPEQFEHLQEKQDVMEMFMTEMSSEVRTPASVIVGYSELLLDEKLGPLNEKQQKGLVAINQSGRFLLKVWDDLLVMSQVLIAQLYLHVEEVDLSQIIEEAIAATWEHWDMAYSSKRPIIEQKMIHPLPNIWADALRMQQAITRIIVTSLNSMSRKEESKIVLTSRHDDNWITLTVTTIGKEPLYFNDHHNPRLFLSRTIIEKHGGQLKVDRTEEFELAISITLPIHQNKPSDNSAMNNGD